MDRVSNCRLWFADMEMMWDGYIDDDNNLFVIYYPHGGIFMIPLDEYDERYVNNITIYPD